MDFKKCLFPLWFHSVTCSYIHIFVWSIRWTIYEMSPLKLSVLFLVAQHVFRWFCLLTWIVNIVICFCEAYKSKYCKTVVEDLGMHFFVYCLGFGFFVWWIGGFLCLGLNSLKGNNCLLSRQPWLVSWIENICESLEQIKFLEADSGDSFKMTLLVQRECILCMGLGLRTCSSENHILKEYVTFSCFYCTVL